jgi:muramoyltetrapeptide carboxypeptidase
MSIAWPALKPRDQIAIIAPGSKPQNQEDHRTLLKSIQEFLAAWELQAVIAEDIFGEDLLCANSDVIRFTQLKNALFDPNIKAIWCLRGGYGCTRLLPMLQNLQKAPAQAKPFIGFSDVTAIHLFLNQVWGWPTLHGPALTQIINKAIPAQNVTSLRELLFGHTLALSYDNLRPANEAAKQSHIVSTVVSGGNLSIIQASLGTAWQIQTAGKCLFLEEVNERAYRIDRLLTHLQQAGIFKDIKALLLGDFIHPQESALIQQVLHRFATPCPFPIYYYTGIGHSRENQTLPLNTSSHIQLNETATLHCLPGFLG